MNGRKQSEDMDNSINEYREKAQRESHPVTLFITTHKRPTYLESAILSALRQTFSPFCIFVIDNDSCDNTKSVVEAFGQPDIFYVSRRSTSEFSNFQFAFSICVTPFLVVMHDDDALAPNYLERMLGTISARNDIAVLTCLLKPMNALGSILADSTGEMPDDLVLFRGDSCLKEAYLEGKKPFHVFPSAIYRHSFYGDMRDFVNPMAGAAGDCFIWFQSGQKGGTTAILPQKLYYYRLHSGQDSNVRGETMDFILMNFLSELPSYESILSSSRSCWARFISRSFELTLSHCLSGISNKRTFRANYSLIPKRVKRNKANKRACLKYWFYGYFPLPVSWIYHLGQSPLLFYFRHPKRLFEGSYKQSSA